MILLSCSSPVPGRDLSPSPELADPAGEALGRRKSESSHTYICIFSSEGPGGPKSLTD